ncbi:acyltransferase family protein [Nocardioides sp. 1609]|uniref:acyltransferase family protein n=1 Tax=Nocardioides sp. 1609 TaxID=2508327 RepID=UPI00106FB0EA|nr:acyltransferase family protein [Nocardioides sp. 1609]
MDSPGTPRTTGFRDDVQGMRALAVLTVIAAHAGVSFLPGGYVGVDVFFVISGFLITQLLVREAARSGRLSLAGFYARRARRILPAAGVVLVATLVASLVWLSVLEAIDLAKDAWWSAVFAANVRFAQEGVDYFSAEEAPSPVQHYWSLAVEEQFYLVWPLLVALCFWWAARRSLDRAVAVRALVALIVVLGALSLVWSVARTGSEPESAYFSSLTRAWELAVGAGVALAVHAGRTLRGRVAADVVAWAGLAAIVVACVAYDEATPFPGSAALLPVLGAGAVLWAGAATTAGERGSAARLLSVAPLRHVGDWSYSLYLWHWPLLVVPATALGRDLTAGETLLVVAATFGLALLTFRLVETPFRTGATWNRPRRTLLLYPAFLAVVAMTATATWAWSEYRVGERGGDPAITAEQYGIGGDGPAALVRASVLAARDDRPLPSDLTPDLVDLEDDVAQVDCLYEDGAPLELCPQGSDEGTRTLVVVGDSHALAWTPAFEEVAERAGYRAYYLVKPQCAAALVEIAASFTQEPWPACQDFHAWTEEQLGGLDPDLLVVTSAPVNAYFADGVLVRDAAAVEAETAAGLERMFEAYRPLAARTVLLADVPRLTIDPAVCLSTPGARMADCTVPADDVSLDTRAMSTAVAAANGVEVVDPAPWLCAEGLCPAVVGSTIAYRDKGHLSVARSRELAEPLGRALGIWPG